MTTRTRTTLVLALSLLAACRTGRNYPSLESPRYAGAPTERRAPRQRGDTLLVVSFNIEFARRIDSAIAVLTSDPAVRDADVILLQEMDAPSAKRIADTLGMHYVYYPAIFHTRTRRDFGNAVLSPWPIVEDAKLILPHTSRYAGTQRTATAATIRVRESLVRESLVRVYSTHLGTVADVRGASRVDQLRAILADAERHQRVIVGGDMNDIDVGPAARALGYAWPTERIPRSNLFGRWDHIFIKGLAVPDSAAGTVLDDRGTSDHRPIWALALLRQLW